jgi:predicted trehalose synthase
MPLSKAQCQLLLPVNRRHQINEGGEVVAEIMLDDTAGLLIFACMGKNYLAPIIKNATTDLSYQRARIDDLVSSKFLSHYLPKELTASFAPLIKIDTKTEELEITADQSNQSIIVNNQFIIKWQLYAQKSVAVEKEKLLDQNNFTYLPKLYGHILWQGNLIATVNQYIPEAVDGWSWCVERAKNFDCGNWVKSLANLAKQMHLGLVGGVHGDFHVGQILMVANLNKMWVIDFEGDPLETTPVKADQIYDLASMCASFFHVGALAIKNGAPQSAIKQWIVQVQNTFLSEYYGGQGFAKTQINKLILKSQDRELAYAQQYLPRWQYAPEFAISYMKELKYGSD